MNNLAAIARSGMNAAQVGLQTSANNIANMNTEGYRRQQVEQEAQAQGGVIPSVRSQHVAGAAVEADVVQQLEAKNAFLANLTAFKRSNAMAGALLDVKA